MEQLDIFGAMREKYKIKKPIRLIELFAGIGSQAKALKNIGADFTHYKVVEFDKYALASYNAVHNTNFETQDITLTSAEDLEIVETDKYDYIMTYSFPCFVEDTLVLTDKGNKKIIDVKVGDLVLTHKNEYQKVKNFFDNGVQKVYKINAMAFHELKTTNNHKFLVRKRTRVWNNSIRSSERVFEKPIWLETKDLTKDYYMGVAINQNNVIPKEKGLEDIITKEQFWFLMGWYLADGWVRKSGGLIIGTNENKVQRLIKILQELKIQHNVVKERTILKVYINRRELVDFVKQFGYYAFGKHLSKMVFDLPKYLLKHLIDGYFFGDGSIIGSVNKVISVSKTLIYDMAQCVAKVYETPYRIYETKTPKTTIIEGRIVNQRDTYTLIFKKEKKKQDKAFYDNGYIWFPINEISYLGEENVYDIEVEKDHSFMANGSIAHNCQDLSLAGKGAGMEKGTNTRSGLLWEVERLLGECDELPQILLMENVPQVIGKKNLKDFRKWELKLESLGYSNYFKNLNAKDYDIPQNRNRTFMISVLGDYYYEFPKKKKLKLRLKDMLEADIDEKYYLSDRMIDFFQQNSKANEAKGNGFRFKPFDNTDIVAKTITTNNGNRMDDNFIIVPEDTKKGYAKAYEGDGIYINRPHQKRGVVQKGMIQTIKAQNGDVGVVDNLRIRKLTPKETWRLMGFTDEDFEKAQKVNSDTQLYKQAGNSIVVKVLEAIFKELL